MVDFCRPGHIYISTGPTGLTVTVTKNNESLSSDVQWDAVNDYLATNYTVTWTSEIDHTQLATVIEQTSYTITGLTLDTVYTITVTSTNMCGRGPEFGTNISFPTGTIITFNVRTLSKDYILLYI